MSTCTTSVCVFPTNWSRCSVRNSTVDNFVVLFDFPMAPHTEHQSRNPIPCPKCLPRGGELCFLTPTRDLRRLSIIFIAKENTASDWTFTCLKYASPPKGPSSNEDFPKILSTCVLSVALLLVIFHCVQDLSRPFPPCIACFSTPARFLAQFNTPVFPTTSSGTSSQNVLS